MMTNAILVIKNFFETYEQFLPFSNKKSSQFVIV